MIQQLSMTNNSYPRLVTSVALVLVVAAFFSALVFTLNVIRNRLDADAFEPLVYKRERANVVIHGRELPVAFLDEVTANETMTQDEFAKLVAKELAKHAKETVTESCASICRATSGAWGAAPLTVGGQIVCPVTPHCPDGMEPTPVSIHSHPLPKGRNFIANDADAALGGRKGRLLRAGDPEAFSSEDIQGKGYVVTYQGMLFYQERRGMVRRLGSVD